MRAAIQPWRRLTRVGALFCAGLLAGSLAQAQPQVLDAGRIGQGLDRLAVLGSVLYIAAHPDDENTQLLAWLAQQRHYRTAYLSLTRGDGGQNLLGNEQGNALGLIRSRELLEARQEDGAEQLFGQAGDFGFSKTSAETLRAWGREQTLGDLVWAIRKFQPDVIITRFPGDSRAGHGHHQASSLLAQEAFRAAADPRRFPQQLSEVQPWQAKRLLWNTWKSFLGSGDTTEPGQLQVDIGGLNPRLGLSYGEIAALSRNHHKSQGFGSAAQRGRLMESFALLDGQAPRQDLFDGVDSTWSRLPQTQAIARQVERLQREYDSAAPARSVPGLAQLHQQLLELPAGVWRERKLQEVQTLLLAAAGVWLETTADAPRFPAGSAIPVCTEILLRSAVEVSVLSAGEHRPLQIDQPLWLNGSAHGLQVSTQLTIAGQVLEVQREIQFKHVDPIRGEVYRPVQFTPPLTLTPSSTAYLFGDDRRRRIEVQLHGFVDGLNGVLQPQAPAGWRITPEQQPFSLRRKDDELTLGFDLEPEAHPQNGELRFQARVDGQVLDKALATVDYGHIPGFDWFPPATATLVKFDLKRGGERIGYLPGAGDRLPQMLRQLGYQVDELKAETLTRQSLAEYDAIVTGVRAYNVNPALAAARTQLLQYVEQGGVLLVQYNTLAPLPAEPLGPYPFTITRDRVTEEDAAVRLLLPEHPLLNHPNPITEHDFDGWVQERGLYFASDIDPRYQRLLGMHDRGEQELRGALISAQVGRGRFIYAPLSFFRQLPAGVPGAARLLANLLAK